MKKIVDEEFIDKQKRKDDRTMEKDRKKKRKEEKKLGHRWMQHTKKEKKTNIFGKIDST